MILEYFTVFCVTLISLTTRGITDQYTTGNDFQYTVCEWYNSKCTQLDPRYFIPSDDNTTSDWPKGPYALFTPKEGCPESVRKGWRRGYLSFTWEQPHILTSATDCDVNNIHNQTLPEKEKDGGNSSKVDTCWRNLIPDLWPEIQSGILGPFSRYAIRLNFCFKTEDSADIDDVYLWPDDSYTIFGDRKACPSGFTSSERMIKLPAISSWTSFGFLPDFTVRQTEADNTVILTLKTCDRQADNILPNEINNQSSRSSFSTDSFIFIKNNQNVSCPIVEDTYVVSETLKLRVDANDNGNLDLLTICYYRPHKWFKDFDGHLYAPRDYLPFYNEPAFVILNPTLIFGNKTISVDNTLFNGFGMQTLYSGYQMISIPWLLIDLGRNLIVVGLQITKFFLIELDSTEYKGSLSRTEYGYPCQRWDEQYPHSHRMTEDDLFPDKTVSNAEFYCRDPEGDTKIWCYTQDPDIRWGYCAHTVYKFQQEDRPFSKCFIGDDRWRTDDFGAISCPYTVSYKPGILYYSFLKELEGRYVKLVGYGGPEGSRFRSLVQNVEVLTSATVLYDESKCNSDLGMGDESIHDSQITASSWLPQTPPTSSRPYFTGWCSDTSDKNPFITVDLMKDTNIEGITIYNWERIDEDVAFGSYKKRFIPVGSKKIMVSFSTDLNMDRPWTYTNRTFSLDTFLPLYQPQTFVHSPTSARYVTVYIIESMTETTKCLRFELHGCRQNGKSKVNLPELLAVNLMLPTTSLVGTELITFNNLQTLTNTSVLSSIDFPAHYPGGMSYAWIIDFPEGNFISLIFTDISFNKFGYTNGQHCRDTLNFLPGAYEEETMYVDQRFNGLVSLIESNLTYMSLAFTTCRPTSKIQLVGHGFKVIVKARAISTCLSPYGTQDNKLLNYCMHPMMYITSVSRLNFPDSNLPEEWIIHIKRSSVHVEIVYFNVRCDTGSLLMITDRFSGEKIFCNLRMVPSDIYSDSDTVHIRFEKGQYGVTANNRRKSAKEGFTAMYKTFEKPMKYLIDSQKTYGQVLVKLAQLEKYWDPVWKNATLLAYKACSKKFEKCYFIYSGALSTWNTAGSECWIRQSRLVSIHSDEEQELIKYLLRNFRYFDLGPETLGTAFSSDNVDPNYFTHIGLSRKTSESGKNIHLWEDGSPVTFSTWNDNEPSSDGACTRMSFHLFNTNNTWTAERCDTGFASYFICEQRLTPELLNMAEVKTHLYTGTLNVTLSGIPCQRWDSQYPHSHDRFRTDDEFADKSVSDAENFCRDPEASGSLWCYTTDFSARWEKCWVEETTDIVTRLYKGLLSKTYSGRTCQRWDIQTPHAHPYTAISHFPDATLEEAANYCRDPSDEGVLWCYTTDQERRWETCSFEETASDRCFSTHSLYTGQWNRTRSGKTCQPWDAQSPHDHEMFLDSQFPDGSVAEASNYCRDPYAEGYLWCFTMDLATKSEPCVFEYKYQLGNGSYDFPFAQNTFECDNGDFIPLRYLCNGIPNCLDITDETNCTNTEHVLMKNRTIATEIPDMNDTFALFQCESKEWISRLARCDGVIDCFDATDEVNCSFSLDVPGCSKDEYTCDDGGCIHVSQMCDFIADCTDASDENCDFSLCSSTEYRCRNQQCIPRVNRCDAYSQCLDGTDETGCDVCKKNAFHCDLNRCIPKRLVCDKYADCKDGSDEMSCDQTICLSCEEWWIAGYRTSGIYTLNDTEAECNFDAVHENGNIYTTFRNFEITTRSGMEQIHSTDTELSGSSNSTLNRFFQNNSYSCFQNITQLCVPAHKAAADYEDPDHENAYRHCDCVVMTVTPGHYEDNSSNVYYCQSDKPVTDMDRIMFHYRESNDKRAITLKENFPTGVEVSFGPVVCKHEDMFDESNVGCGDGNVLPESVRCIYDRDQAGFILGCRSGEHLQGCETFQCPESTVKCPRSFCLPLKFICDGEIQCPGGQDEQDCGCQDDDREVLLLYEDGNSYEENQSLRSIATQFHTTNSIVRELRYHSKTLPDKLDLDHKILDISDTEINPYSTINRQFVCNYSILASDVINRIYFSKENARGLIFFQKRNDTDNLSESLFRNLKSMPDFLIYRIIQGFSNEATGAESFPFVQNVVVKRLSTLATAGSKYFPDLCTEATNVYCPHEYRCAASKTCIPLEQVCDGYAQCAHGDDERLCGFSCPDNCSCVEYSTDCSLANISNTAITYMHRKSRSLDLSGNPGLQKTLTGLKWHFPYLILLNLSKCHLNEITNNAFQALVNLRILDLSFNSFFKIPGSAFIGLRKLRHLNLFGNSEMYSLDPYSLHGLLSIQSLEIRGATIRRLSAHAFAGLQLDQLNLSDNKIIEVEDGAFSGLNVKVLDIETNKISSFNKGLFRGVSGITSLHAPAFKFCCVRPNYLAEENCFPEKDEFSSCDDLLRLSALQTMLWLIGILALFGNILSVIYRLVYDREKLKLGYGIFVTNLAVADFLMGIYLIIIAIADAAFRKRYIFMDDYWRNSAWCTIAGFLSTVSSEASVFFLCLITLDRLFVIKYPFGQIRFDSNKSGIACLISWLVALSVGLIPILYSGYFHDQFYSKSGVCIALPLTRDRPPGWLYSIIVFIGLNFVTFCLIAIGQIIIYYEIKKATSGIRRSSSRRDKGGSGRRRELTVARNLLLVVATDFLCWFPIGCMGMMALSGHVIPGDVYAWTAVFILPVNSALNPVLYTLTAILGKKKPEPQVNTIDRSVSSPHRVKKVKPFNGLFRYFITRKDSIGHEFVRLDDIPKENMTIGAADVVKMSLHLTRSIRLLHKHSMVMEKLDGSVVCTSVENGKIVGDIQLRHEPTVCNNNDRKADDIYQLGQVIRSLLAKRNNFNKQTTS